MATFTLQEIYNKMKESPVTIPAPNYYILDLDTSTNPRTKIFQIADGVKSAAQCCAIGEAAIQLAKLSKSCFTRTQTNNNLWAQAPVGEYAIKSLEKCIPETAVKKVLPFPPNYRELNDINRLKETQPVSFWRRVEEWYSFTNNKHSRIWCIAKAAKEFRIELNTKY